MSKYKNNSSGRRFPIGTVLVVIGIAGIVGLLLYLSSANPPIKGNSGSQTLNDLIGKPMPSAQLKDKDGNPYSLDGLKGKNVVLFFNEGVMCYPACWNQVAALGTDPKLNSDDTVSLSVVTDRPDQWQQAMAKMPDLAKATILFDQGGTVSSQLGLLTVPSSMHKGSNPGHTYVVLDKAGIVRYVYDDPNMAINNSKIIQKIAEFNK